MNEPSATTRALRSALLAHYDAVARDLPWRRESDPYRIWVSEVMLQQTRVETVIGYYEAWLRRFPGLEELAEAPVDEVLKAWEGLGYYRRARNLHRGAQVVRERHGGEVPSSYDDLRRLPGVGEYTAGAVASIAFGEAVPAVDGNVRRVLARLFDVAEPGAAWLRKTAGALVDPDRPGDWNQALMELGATVCTPTSPSCDACPVAEWCAARAAGTQDQRPAPSKKKTVPTAAFATAVVVDGEGRLLLVRRPEGGLLGGMWSFPEAAVEEAASSHLHQGAREAAREAGASLGEEEPKALEAVRHRFTHLDATYHPVLFRGDGESGGASRWLTLAELSEVALPVAQQKIVSAAADMLPQIERT